MLVEIQIEKKLYTLGTVVKCQHTQHAAVLKGKDIKISNRNVSRRVLQLMMWSATCTEECYVILGYLYLTFKPADEAKQKQTESL